MKKFFIATLMSIFFILSITAEELISLEFKNQKITDILMSISSLSGKSIAFDDTVTGNATFTFNNESFENALLRFANFCHLFVENDNGIYYVSKIFLSVDEVNKTVTVNAEDVSASTLIKELSRKTKVTVMTDSFPNQMVTVRLQNVTVQNVLELIVSRFDGFELAFENGGYFIRDTGNRTQKRTDTRYSINERNGLYTLNAQRAQTNVLVSALFNKAGKEFSYLSKNSAILENIVYANKEFDVLLSLILEQANCDFSVKDNIYYIFDIQQKDPAKSLKQTKTYKLKYLNVTDVTNLFPSDLNAQSFIKTDKNVNSFYITGSEKEIEPIVKFLDQIDVPLDNKTYGVYAFHNMPVTTGLSMIPKNILISDAVIIPNTSSFMTLVTPEVDVRLKDFISTIDIQDNSRAIRLKYIKSEELLKYFPPGTDKSRITVTADTNLVFFTGNEEQYKKFIKDLNVLDQPKEQIRYQLLVIQYQKTEGMNLGVSFSISKTDEDPYSAITANFTNLLNINFDVVAQFGLQAAGALNAEISESKAKVLADTTLNGLSGEDINFENKNIYRYRDIITDNTNTATYSSVVREISTGLSIKINGWVSGDEMITVSVSADLSKQGKSDSSTDVPSTSEKSVKTNVRTKSGEPIVISGLLQQETDKTETRIPFLGKIPLLGRLFKTTKDSVSTTELVIYLVPFVEKKSITKEIEEKNIRSLYEKYIAD